MNLGSTQKLQVLLGGAKTTNELACAASWEDTYAEWREISRPVRGGSGMFTSGATAVDLVPAPGTDVERTITGVMIRNGDTVAQVVTIRTLDGIVPYIMASITLAVGYTLYWSREAGMVVTDTAGRIQYISGTPTIVSPLMGNPVDLAGLATDTAMGSGVCQVLLVGKAPAASSSIDVLTNVTVAGVAAITWAEVAIYKGTFVLGALTPALTRLGYTNVAATFNSTGIKKTTVPLTVPAAAGDSLFVVLGSVCAVTMFQVRGGLADEVQSGAFQTLTARPSTEAGPVAGVLAAANAVPGKVQIICN